MPEPNESESRSGKGDWLPGMMIKQREHTEGERSPARCHVVFQEVAYIHNVGHVLARAWDALEPARRQESIDRLRERLVGLNDRKAVRVRASNDVFNFLETLEQYNRGQGTIHDLQGKMDGLTEELAIHAICDCSEQKKIV